MKIEFYEQLNKNIRHDDKKRKIVLLLNDVLPYVIALVYLITLIIMLIHSDFRRLFMLIFIPFVGFCLARIMRFMLKSPRPARLSKSIRPLVRKRKKTYSFPSCHAASSFVIGTAMLSLSLIPTGVITLLLALFVCIFRVLSGAHFIRDVLCGALLGTIIGLVPCFIF